MYIMIIIYNIYYKTKYKQIKISPDIDDGSWPIVLSDLSPHTG